jgi:hypothetical protein
MPGEAGAQPVGYQDLTVGGTPIGLDSGLILQSRADGAFLSVEGNAIRFKVSGIPSTTSGHLLDPPTGGQNQAPSWRIKGHAALLSLLIIAVSGTATVRVSYFLGTDF